MEQSFIAYIENSIKENWDLDALTDYNGATLQYKDVARKIEKVHLIFEASGIKKGDKIAICGRNSSHWGVTFLATLTYGAVAVPILHEFKADNVHNIVNHSEAKLLFVGDQVWENLNESAMTILEGIILMTDFSILISRTQKLDYAREHLNELFGKKYPKNFRKEHIEYHKDQPEELAVINYTSGTTSYSKGGNAALPQPVVQYGIRIRSIAIESRRQDYLHVANGTHVRVGIRIPVRVLSRMSDLLPNPHAKPQNHFPGILGSEAAPGGSRTTYYRKDYQEERASETGNTNHEAIAESSHHQ